MLFKRLALLWTVLRGDARLVLRALRHPDAPAWLKAGVAGVVLYVLSPIDIIPDFIPFIGAVDDVIVVTFALRWLARRLPAHIVADVSAPR